MPVGIDSSGVNLEFETMSLITARGDLDLRYYKTSNGSKTIILVGGAGGGFDSPVGGTLYPKLCGKFKSHKVASLLIKFRNSTNLIEAVFDVMEGIKFLQKHSIKDVGLIGHSFGGAVIAQAAYLTSTGEKDIKGIKIKLSVFLATQSYRVEPIASIHTDIACLFLHGTEDNISPPVCSQYTYNLVPGYKSIKTYERTGHSFIEAAQKIEEEIYKWVKDFL